MASTWNHSSPNLKKGVGIINKLDCKKFQLLLNRIVLEIKQNLHIMSVFTDEEKEKLISSLSINTDELNLLINSCIIIIYQAVYNITSPDKFKLILIEQIKLNEDKALCFSNVWSTNAKSLILKMKQKSVYSTQLEDVSWLVNIEISSQDNPQTFIPKSILQLKLKEDSRTNNLNLELDEKELFTLYNTLENIQGALDSLS